MARTGSTAQWSERANSGAAVSVGLGYAIADGAGVQLSTTGGPSTFSFVTDGAGLALENVPTGDAYLLAFGEGLVLQDNPT